jgi:hypothetical protein
MADWRRDVRALAASYAELHSDAEFTEESEHRAIEPRRGGIVEVLTSTAGEAL